MKTISGMTPNVRQGSIVAMSTTAARSDPVFMKDDPCKMFVHPGHQDAQDSMRMREAKTCGCSAGILRERRRAKDEPSMFSASYCSLVRCAKLACVENPKFLALGLMSLPSVLLHGGRLNSVWTSNRPPTPRRWSCRGPRPTRGKSRGDRGSNVPCIAGGCVLTISDDDPGE